MNIRIVEGELRVSDYVELLYVISHMYELYISTVIKVEERTEDHRYV